jgi:hypothetical protein
LFWIRKELEQYTYYIPPNFPEHLSIPADGATMEKIVLLKLTLELEKFAQERSIDELLDREKYVWNFLITSKGNFGYSSKGLFFHSSIFGAQNN